MPGPGMKQKKKMVIKSYKVKPKLPENYLDETWKQLAQAVSAVHRAETMPVGFESLYKAVEGLCVHRLGGELYDRLEAACDSHVDQLMGALVGRNPDCVAFLEDLDHAWQEHCKQMQLIRSIFLVLDRKWVIPNSRAVIWEMGLQQFRKYLCRYIEVQQKGVEGLLRLLEKDRMGEQVDRMRLKSLLRMLCDLRIYDDVFEAQFLEATEHFYRAEGAEQLAALTTAEYLRHAEGRLASEAERVSNYLDAGSTRKPLITIVEDRLLRDHVVTVLEKGFDGLVSSHCVRDLGRLYTLLSRVGGLERLRAAFSSYIKRAGMEIVNAPDDEALSMMVEELLSFKSKLDELLSVAFDSSPSFTHTLKESCENFINVRQNKPAELIAKYIDSMLKTGNKGTTEEEVESKLERLLVLFRYVNGKDVFEAFYKKDLARRLLLGKSGSTDAEKSMISKLKNECGSQFTNKLEGMFKDIELSKDIMASFQQSAKTQEQIVAAVGEDVDLQVNILTAVHWPTYPQEAIKLQAELSQMQDVFKEFYLDKYSGRCLGFLNQLGTCVIKAEFLEDAAAGAASDAAGAGAGSGAGAGTVAGAGAGAGGRSKPKSKKHELSVSVFQAVVLLLFNEVDCMPFATIATHTGMGPVELKRTLQSLACGKKETRVLRKEPAGREVSDEDVFHVNTKFSNKKYRVKINQIQLKETVRSAPCVLPLACCLLCASCH